MQKSVLYQVKIYFLMLQMTKKSLAYFAYIDKRTMQLDAEARHYLRSRGFVKPEYDDLDETCSISYPKHLRVDPSSVHRRNGDEAPTICYNIYCRNHSKCTCKALSKFTPTITID
ncbi:hypothetical protein DICVIV_07635 [Dictyocaulus viviparus]|uniref:Uncharacterized protein n=1 Tax=Dictyocaulus viviparus TaxID=29172 RepID=A0A0D8XR99_DICVI|nr:hypothetical protein DICVIV_07635 [Dictyocaulus viviparus]